MGLFVKPPSPLFVYTTAMVSATLEVASTAKGAAIGHEPMDPTKNKRPKSLTYWQNEKETIQQKSDEEQRFADHVFRTKSQCFFPPQTPKAPVDAQNHGRSPSSPCV